MLRREVPELWSYLPLSPRPDLSLAGSPRRCQADDRASSIGRVWGAFDQAVGLERVDESGHPAGGDRESTGELLHRLGPGVLEGVQEAHPDIAHGRAWCARLDPARPRRTELGELCHQIIDSGLRSLSRHAEL